MKTKLQRLPSLGTMLRRHVLSPRAFSLIYDNRQCRTQQSAVRSVSPQHQRVRGIPLFDDGKGSMNDKQDSMCDSGIQLKQYDFGENKFSSKLVEQVSHQDRQARAFELGKLSGYSTKLIVADTPRKRKNLRQFLLEQSQIMENMKREQELAYQSKQREQQLTRLITRWEEVNQRKLQSRLEDMGLPRKTDYQLLNKMKMQIAARERRK